jgi:hypothetical protein
VNLQEGNQEQLRRMEIYREKISKELGFDIGETGYFAWIDRYAAKFRRWAESLPPESGITGYKKIDFKED